MTEEQDTRPIILITGMSGNIGSTLAGLLEDDYRLVGLDRSVPEGADNQIKIDLGSEDSVKLALNTFRERYGERIAAVVHLAAYFDFTGEESPLYDKVNVKGTRYLLDALQDFQVERFIYSSTMLVNRATEPGGRIDEDAPVEPKWAYPESKARAEEAIREHHGHIPYLILRLAGLYDDRTAVPTLAHQIARIYERDMKSHVYAGDLQAGQSFVHKDDMMDLFHRAVDRRNDLPEKCVILGGEEEAVSYRELQNLIGRLVHGDKEWETLTLPESLAKAGAWLQEKAEPIVPDDFDQGEKPFIRPFMIDLASDHYALNISKARKLLGWEPRHSIRDTLPRMIDFLKQDAEGWYRANGITEPDWMQAAEEKTDDPQDLRERYETWYRAEHRRTLWGHFINMGLGAWLLTSPAILGYGSTGMRISDILSGLAILVLASLCLSWRLARARWAVAVVGCWVLFAPLVFHVPSAAAYLNGTLVGALVIGFAACLRPAPGISPPAGMTGPAIPPGWQYTPSSLFQRMFIILLAFLGFFISRHMAAYQLGHIEGIWEPFFAGANPGDGKNGSEEITTSWVSEAWPVPDAGLGALVYMLEILTGLMGSNRRWRTMPWLVLLFGFLIIPLGAVSITFIIIQPILLSTWCTVCLIAAAAMLMQIPYSFDEIVATSVFLWRRWKAGRPVLRILFVGDTEEEGGGEQSREDFERSPLRIVRDMLAGGLTLPWNLLVCIAIGIWLMFTRLTLGAEGGMANADHLIGALIITVSVTALAEVVRLVRLLNIPLGAVLLVTPFIYDASLIATVASLIAGLAVIVLSFRRGPVRYRYGEWSNLVH